MNVRFHAIKFWER